MIRDYISSSNFLRFLLRPILRHYWLVRPLFEFSLSPRQSVTKAAPTTNAACTTLAKKWNNHHMMERIHVPRRPCSLKVATQSSDTTNSSDSSSTDHSSKHGRHLISSYLHKVRFGLWIWDNGRCRMIKLKYLDMDIIMGWYNSPWVIIWRLPKPLNSTRNPPHLLYLSIWLL